MEVENKQSGWRVGLLALTVLVAASLCIAVGFYGRSGDDGMGNVKTKLLQTPTAYADVLIPTPTPWEVSFDEYIAGLTVPPEVEAIDVTKELARTTEQLEDYVTGEIETCESADLLLQKAIEDFIVLDPNLGELYPGAIVQSAPLIDQGLLQRVDLPRSGASLVISGLPLENISTQISITNQTNVLEAINDLLPKQESVPVADISYEFVEVDTKEQAILQLGFSADPIEGVFAGVNIGPGSTKNTVVLKLVQNYYTVTFNQPNAPSETFRPLSIEQVGEFMSPENSPAYISSVTYGRYLIMVATSEVEPRKLRAALEFNLNNALTGEYTEFELTEAWENTSLQIVAKGGAADDALAFITENDLNRFMTEGGTVSAESRGVPITYRAAYLHNHQPIRIDQTAEFNNIVCNREELAPSHFRISLDSICIVDTGDGRIFSNADIFFDFNVLSLGDKIEVKAISEDDPLKLSKNIGCSEPYTFNATKSIKLPTRNGTCFLIESSFHDKDIVSDDFIGNVENEKCFFNGVWQDANSLTVNNIQGYSENLTGGGANWQIDYSIQLLGE